LRFTTGLFSENDALKALDSVFEEDNAVLLLLDGYNEVPENQRSALDAEIAELRRYNGLTIVLTTRTVGPALSDFERFELQPLTSGQVTRYLTSLGLLYPAGEGMQTLLTNPMSLVMYAGVTSSTGAHSETYTEATLIGAYLNYVVSKANNRVIAGFAVNVVAPLIAKAMEKHKAHAIPATELATIIERIYSELTRKTFTRAFPDYIGLTGELIGTASNSDGWFRIVITQVLYGELALLTKTESGQYSFRTNCCVTTSQSGESRNARNLRLSELNVLRRESPRFCYS
jgi:hypothetical protein